MRPLKSNCARYRIAATPSRQPVKAAEQQQRSAEIVTLSPSCLDNALGQHFLTNASCQRIIRTIFGSAAAAPEGAKSRPSENRPGDVWIEIGAGHGEMTELLAQQARRVVAIEIDERLLPRLCQVASRLGNVSVVAGDVLSLDLAELAAGERFRVYGNLPYYITRPSCTACCNTLTGSMPHFW